MVISFNPKFNIGDIVYSKIDPGIKMIVHSYYIMNVDENGLVVHYIIDCGSSDGTLHTYRPFELELSEPVRREV